MYTQVKTAQEIEGMRESGRMLGTVLALLEKKIAIGQSGLELSEIASQELKGLGGEPAFLGYQGFPDIICISVNDAVVHGIPNSQAFQAGDVVSFDFGVRFKGMITDAARSVVLGDSSPAKLQKLVSNTERALNAGIDKVRDGVRVGTIAAAIEEVMKAAELGIVRELVGHGVGHELHEDPNIPNYGSKDTGEMLKAGMTIAIEPMSTLGGESVVVDSDGWTVRTRDGSLSAHFEDTVLITSDGAEILTRL